MTDVCLILEGTYPYVAGGVSSWVYELIKRLPDTTFSIIYLGANRPKKKKMHYPIPHNVREFEEYYLFDYRIQKEKHKKLKWDDYKVLEEFLTNMKAGDTKLFQDIYELIGDKNTRKIDLHQLIHSHNTWRVLESLYKNEDHESSFIDYFWSWRFIYLPFFSLLRIPLLSSRVYHTVSTGYAGVVGTLCKMRYNRPLLLTEHGIYTRERKIEISQADWIYSETAHDIVVRDEHEVFKEWWLGLFKYFSKLTYEWADEIITLFDGNRELQILDGADSNKIKIIPNGIDIAVLKSLEKEKKSDKVSIGFMGRVVPIKDVKTFIRAMTIVHQEMKNAIFYVMGPTDEDEQYFQECHELARREGLKDVMFFTGKVDVKQYYPKMDLIVLTSISEAQPIVILEAMACGIPVVATRVGACAEMLYGRSPDDKLLGQNGIVTPVCNPQATAQACLDILTDRDKIQRMVKTGIERVEAYYQMDDVIANYKKIYDSHIETIHW